MITPQFPFSRLEYPGIDNPIWVSDIKFANDAVIAAIKAIGGLSGSDFAIITGLDYAPGAATGAGTYGAGVFYLKGSFYYQPDSFNEGYYLVPFVQGTISKGFNDGQARNVYNIYYSTAQSNPAGATPQFTGTMNGSRIGSKFMKAEILALQAIVAQLGTSAYRNIGQGPGTVAAGDDPRLVYTKDQFTQIFSGLAALTQVLTLDNVTAYTPTQDYHPATKKYTDGLSAKRLASGNKPIGDIPSQGITVTIAIGTTLADTNYIALVTPISLSANGGMDGVYQVAVRNKTTTSFDVYLQEPQAGTQNMSLDWIVFHF